MVFVDARLIARGNRVEMCHHCIFLNMKLFCGMTLFTQLIIQTCVGQHVYTELCMAYEMGACYLLNRNKIINILKFVG